MADCRRLGVFDSGLGGLAVAGILRKSLPHHSILCAADTAYMPYGHQTTAVVQQRSTLACQTLLHNRCDAVLVACNSAASVASALLRARMPPYVQLMDVVEATVAYLGKHFYGANIALLATEHTVRSGTYVRGLASYRIKVQAIPANPWALMIEQNFLKGRFDLSMIARYLQKAASVDAIVLGCTHYSLIKKAVENIGALKVPVVDTVEVVSQAMAQQMLPFDKAFEDTSPESLCMLSGPSLRFERAARVLFSPSVRCSSWQLLT